MSSPTLPTTLVAMLAATRRAERDIFGALAPDVRDRPIRPGDWSPKDHQAHLSAWKGRQADRYAAARSGHPLPPGDEQETDAINAQLRAARAEFSWAAVEAEAEEVGRRLESEVLATDDGVFAGLPRLIDGTFGNGSDHAAQHFGWLRDAGVPVDGQRIATFLDEVEEVTRTGTLPETARGNGLYNLACWQSLAGRLERARPLLREAVGLRPELAELAPKDDDLKALRGELRGLLGQ